MPFQTLAYTRPAPAVAGDFCSSNPAAFYAAGPGGLVAGTGGVTVGRFAWVSFASQDWDGGPLLVNSFGAGPVSGFVHREQQGLITTYLADNGLSVPAGYQVAIATLGDFWIKNEGTTEALPGQYAFANYSTGAASFLAASSTPTTGASTTSTISAQTASVTASISGNVMTVTAVGSGTLYPGSMTTSGALTGTQIVSQLSGTTGGVGTYSLNYGEQTVASGTIGTSYGLLTVSGTVSGSWAVGQLVGGGSVTAGTYITANSGNGASLTGAGGAGTYVVNLTQSQGSAALTSGLAVQTKWLALSSGLVGELVRCSAQALG